MLWEIKGHQAVQMKFTRPISDNRNWASHPTLQCMDRVERIWVGLQEMNVNECPFKFLGGQHGKCMEFNASLDIVVYCFSKVIQ